MNASRSLKAPLLGWTGLGSVLQIAMVVTGHFVEPVAALFPVIGTGISLVVGLLFGAKGATALGNSAWGGALAGALCSVPGVAVSVGLGDVGPEVFGIAAGAGVVAGAIGGLAGFGAVGRKG